MTVDELQKLGADETSDEFRFYELWEKLIVDNEALEGAETAESKAMTRGQLLLSRLGTFHSQVSNGGIEQFFWNCPYLIFGVHDDLQLLASEALLERYEKAMENLFGKKDAWMTLHDEWNAGGKHPDFRTFTASRELLDIDWYNSQFFGKWENGRQLERGLGDELVRLAIAYVQDHPSEFVRSGGP